MKNFINICKNILPFAPILYGVIISIRSMLDVHLDPQPHILTLVTLTAATLISERIFILSDVKNEINNTNKGINDINIELSRITESSETITFKTEDDAVNYINRKTSYATNSVWRASLDDQRERKPTKSRIEYWKSREEKIFKDEISYRYVTVLYKETGVEKLNKYNKYVNEKKLTKFYESFYIASPLHIPLVSFIIIDQNEVFTRSPVTRGSEDEYIVIKNKKIVDLFKKYFNDLSEHGRSIKGESYDELKKEFCETHQIESL